MSNLKRRRYSKKYYRENKEKCLKNSAKRYQKDKKKILARMRKLYAANPTKFQKKNKAIWLRKSLKERRLISRQRAVKHLYKLSFADHEAILIKQNYRCPISGKPVDFFSHIDHDHTCCPGIKSCGKCIRGILYGKINSALGYFPNPKWLLKAYKYVTK